MFRSVEWIENVIGKEFTVAGSGEPHILPEGMAEIRDWVPVFLSDRNWAAIGTEMVTNKGRFTRRLANFVYREFGIKMTDSDLAAIGNIANRQSAASDAHIVRIDRELWKPGTFGDDDSCFFGGRKAAPKIFFKHGGAAIKLYAEKDKSPLSRAWVVPTLGRAVIFNPYTVRYYPTQTPISVARVATNEAAPFPGMNSSGVGLVNFGYANETIWINGGNGAIVFPDGFEWDEEVLDMRLKIGRTCRRCGDLLDDPEAGFYDGQYYCAEHWPFVDCPICGQQSYVDLVRTLDNVRCCHACFAMHVRRCNECGDFHHRENMVYGGNTTWHCRRCVERRDRASSTANSVLNNTNSSVFLAQHGDRPMRWSESANQWTFGEPNVARNTYTFRRISNFEPVEHVAPVEANVATSIFTFVDDGDDTEEDSSPF